VATTEELIKMIKDGSEQKVRNKEPIPPAVFIINEDGEVGVNMIKKKDIKMSPVIVSNAQSRFPVSVYVTRAQLADQNKPDEEPKDIITMEVKDGDEHYALFAEIRASGDWQELGPWEQDEIKEIKNRPDPNIKPKLN
jgi:hypothetical protein